MLTEWLERLLTTCPLHLQDMGCLREMLGLRRRWRRHRVDWEDHCGRSAEVIQAAIELSPQRRKAVVLGSGWLHDVPLDDMARLFREVVLVDLFHPWTVRCQARRYRNVRLVADDVTGTLHEVWRVADRPDESLPRVAPRMFLDDPDVDLTVSLNLVSQLPCLPEAYLRRCGAHSDEAILAYCRGLIRAHLDYLQALPGVVTLLTDVEVETYGTSDPPTRSDTLFGVELPWRDEGWPWFIVPNEVLTVVGIEDIKDTPRA